MKKIPKVIMILLLALFISLILILAINRTFFKQTYTSKGAEEKEISFTIPKYSYYRSSESSDEETTVKLISLRSVESIEKDIEEYFTELKSCFNESYYSDENLTFIKYQVNKRKLHKEIEIVYVVDNLCKDEFVLENDWLTQLPLFDEMVLYDNSEDTNSPDKQVIESADLTEVLRSALTGSRRIRRYENVQIDERSSLLEFYSGTVKLTITPYRGRQLLFKLLDENDHSKNAIYQVDDPDEKLLEIYKQFKVES